MELKESIDFTLSSPVTYHKDGSETESSNVVLKCPSRKHYKHSRIIKQAFFRAIKGLSDSNASDVDDGKKEGESQIKGSEIIPILLMSENVDITQCTEEFKKLVINGVGEMEDGTPILASMYDKFTENDEEAMLGEYMANFLLPYWMERVKKG